LRETRGLHLAKAGKKLSEKRLAFIDAYMSNGNNATQAAITAGYAKRSAKQQASQLLTFHDVSEEINKRRAKLAKSSNITVESQVEKYEEIRKLSLEAKQFGPANTAVKGQSDLLGIEAPKKIAISGDLSGIFQVVADES